MATLEEARGAIALVERHISEAKVLLLEVEEDPIWENWEHLSNPIKALFQTAREQTLILQQSVSGIDDANVKLGEFLRIAEDLYSINQAYTVDITKICTIIVDSSSESSATLKAVKKNVLAFLNTLRIKRGELPQKMPDKPLN